MNRLLTKYDDLGLQTKHSMPMELKASANGTIEGYASVFGVIDSYNERVMPGAFTKSLRSIKNPKMLWQHDPSKPIGIWKEAAEDSKGLYVKGDMLLGKVAQADEAFALIDAGVVDGLSIGYRTMKAQAGKDAGKTVLDLLELKLYETSVVTFGANDKARITSIKNFVAAGEMPTTREFEEFLRDAGGFSKAKATALASACAPHLRGEPADAQTVMAQVAKHLGISLD